MLYYVLLISVLILETLVREEVGFLTIQGLNQNAATPDNKNSEVYSER